MLESIVFILLAIAAFLGLKKGLIGQAASLAGIILGITACRLFGSAATGVVTNFLPDDVAQSPFGPYAATILGSIALFLLVGLVVTLAARALKIVAHIFLLGPIDKIAGAAVGVSLMAIVLSILINIWFLFSPPTPDQTARYREGHVLPVVMGIAPHLMGAGDEYNNTDFNDEPTDTMPTQDMPAQDQQ